MSYDLTPVQKSILAAAGMDVNFRGDANDFSCLLSRVALKLFMSGDTSAAWQCFLNDPMACYGTTYDAWEKHMHVIVDRHQEMERAMEATAESWSNAG